MPSSRPSQSCCTRRKVALLGAATVALICVAPPSEAANLNCPNATTNSLLVEFDAVPDTDLYYVAIYSNGTTTATTAATGTANNNGPASNSNAPFMLQTALQSPLVIGDLLPGHSYFLQLRSHPSSAPSVVWGWRSATSEDGVQCATAAALPGQITSLRRSPNSSVQEDALELEWRVPTRASLSSSSSSNNNSSSSNNNKNDDAAADDDDDDDDSVRDFDVVLQRLGAHDAPITAAGVFSSRITTTSAAPDGRSDVGASDSLSFIRRQVRARLVVTSDDDYGDDSLGSSSADGARNEDGTALFRASITGLAAASTYAVTVAAASSLSSSSPPLPLPPSTGTPSVALVASDVLIARTAPTGHNFTEMYRVSEYIADFDFLPNHDSASFEAASAFLTNTNDNDFFNLSKSSPPVTKYCVEHLLPPPEWQQGLQRRLQQKQQQQQQQHSLSYSSSSPPQIEDLPSDPFAPYISCNGPEAYPRTHPSDPLCICDVYADRLIALQPEAEVEAACGTVHVDPHTGEHDAPPCICGNESVWNISLASASFVGAATIWDPYFYWQLPKPSYPGARVSGMWFSTPKGGDCGEARSVGDGGCTWKRHAVAEAVFGAQLLAGGWNNTVGGGGGVG
jgi:hypothetical protein